MTRCLIGTLCVEKALERDYFMTAEAAQEFGLVDQVLVKRPEAGAA